jgi:hypothetical protein
MHHQRKDTLIDAPHDVSWGQLAGCNESDILRLKVSNPEQTKCFHWKNTTAPGIEHGRIGLRHMWGRSACYRDISISAGEKAGGNRRR